MSNAYRYTNCYDTRNSISWGNLLPLELLMFKSCEECTMKCCKSGEGPFEAVPFKNWYYGMQSFERYNKMCENYDPDTELCKIWGTEELPVECEIFVCQNRTFSEEELDEIEKKTNAYNKKLMEKYK